MDDKPPLKVLRRQVGQLSNEARQRLLQRYSSLGVVSGGSFCTRLLEDPLLSDIPQRADAVYLSKLYYEELGEQITVVLKLPSAERISMPFLIKLWKSVTGFFFRIVRKSSDET